MHGFSSGSIFRLNAEADSMGGVVDGGVVFDTKPSPRCAAIEKAQAELRLEYDVREERRRELEFLEKGGDPLDFKLGHAASVSVQSTSHTDQQPDQNLTSEAKGSFALTPSPHRDSVESSGRLGVTSACEPNSADNFDGENGMLQSNRKSIHPVRRKITPSEYSSQFDRRPIVKEIEDPPIFHPKKGQLYRRRNRSKPNRDYPRSNSADMASHGGNGSSLPDRHGILSQPVASESRFEMESDGTQVMHSMTSEVSKFAEEKLNLSNSKEKLEEVQNPADEALVTIRTVEPAVVVEMDNIVILDADCPPSGADKIEHITTAAQLNETSEVNGADNCAPTDAPINTAPIITKGIESESSCSQTIVGVNENGNIDSDLITNLKNVDSSHNDEAPKEFTVPAGENSISIDHKKLSEDQVTNALEITSCIKEDRSSIGHQGKGSVKEDHAEVDRGKSYLQEDVSYVEGQKKHDDAEIKSEKELDELNDCILKMESSCPVRLLVEPASDELNRNGFSGQPLVLETQPCTQNQSKPQDKAQEDMILEEARMIVAKRKRIAALSIGPSPIELRHRCHWDLVLEEMAWLASDFSQERLWKMTAAAQICRHVAFASRKRLLEQSRNSKQKSVAHTLAKAVMDFWHSASLSVENADCCQLEKSKHEALSRGNEKDKVSSRDDFQSTRRKLDHAVCGYAVRFLQLNCSPKPLVDVEVPWVTDMACDNGLPELSRQYQFTEENIFYTVPIGAMEMYRKSVELCLADPKRSDNHIQEEVILSMHDAAAGNDYEDGGGHLYYQPGALDTRKPLKKKQKKMKSYAARSYELEGDFGYENCEEIRNGTAQLNVMGKRHANNLHVDSIPLKRMRTASRQRVVGPFSAGSVGIAPVLSRADASSEDTNSFHDDKNTLHSGSVVPTALEVDSTMNFEKQSTLDSAEMLAKHKKNKKTKHQSLSYDHRWQLDSSMQNDQKDLVRKRSDNHHLESNGNGSLFGQHAKKPKFAKHSVDKSFDHTAPMSGSVPSSVASQMSNLSSQTRLIKLIGGRDRGKKSKGLKVSAGQLGSGSPWTIVEDQALVVLVHDMGPNWELVSDAINSILQFKCIFRKPQECKERHKFLMDKPSGDGADSGEDSGSSQPYPSTLPGIPKGSARQLFQSLHAHVEEDNIKSRFEKIIRIEQQLYFRKKKYDNPDLKHIVSAHGSHALSLSQVMPNNVNGGVLTPLDLCDTSTSNQDPFSMGNQSSHAGGLQLPHQSSIPPMHTPSGLSSPHQSLQGSPNMAVGNNLASPPSQLTSTRDARYSVPRSGSLPVEEQQRLHQYNSMLQGRSIQASNLPSSGSVSGSDRGVHMHPGNGVSVRPGMNRGIPMVRPGVQGIPSSPTLNSASVLSSNIGGVPSNMNMHGTASGRGNGNTVYRPRDSLHGVRSGQSSEHQRQMISAGMQMHATQTNNPGVAQFGSLSSGFSNNQATSPLQSYPGHHHPHSAIPEQQAFSRMSRERQMHQRLSHHKHQQHPTSSALMTHTQTPSQLPMSSPPPSQPVPSPTIHVVQPTNVQGLGRSAQLGRGGMTSKGGKQRQHPQQRQQSQSQQDPKFLKGVGRNNMVIHPNLPIDPSQLNGLSSANSASQVVEEEDPAMHLMQGQNLYSASALNTLPTSKPVVCTPTSSLTQPQKSCVNICPATSKPVQQISSHLDGGKQGKALGSNKGLSTTVVLSRNRQQLQGQPSLKMVNQSQSAIQRKSQQNRQMNSDCLTTSQVDRSLSELKSTSMGPPQACVQSVCDSSEASEFSQSGSGTSQAVTNSSVIEPLLSVSQGNNLVSRELEAQRQQQELPLQSSPLQPILPQKQSHIKFDQSAV